MKSPSDDSPWGALDRDGKVARVLDRAEQGMTASEIAVLCGASRGAIIGLIHRSMPDFKLSGLKTGRPVPAGERKPRRPRTARPPRVVIPRPEPVPEPPSLQIPFDAVARGQCRFIAGDPLRGGTYCGQSSFQGSAWCAFHFGVVYKPREERARI